MSEKMTRKDRAVLRVLEQAALRDEIPVEVVGHAIHRVIAVSVTHDDDDHAEVLLEQRSADAGPR